MMAFKPQYWMVLLGAGLHESLTLHNGGILLRLGGNALKTRYNRLEDKRRGKINGWVMIAPWFLRD